MSQITVERLTKRYGETLAVDDLSFTVEAGRVTGFLGPQRRGQVDDAARLLGLIRPTSGKALVHGPAASPSCPIPIRTVGAALDGARRAPRPLRARAPAHAGGGRAGCPSSRVDEVLDMVELTPARDRRVKGYSMGMRQRLALARRCSATRRSWCSTSPPTAWTRRACAGCATCSSRSPREGRAVLHLQPRALRGRADRRHVVVIRAGRLVMQGTLAELVKGDRAADPRALAAPATSCAALLEAGRRAACRRRAARRDDRAAHVAGDDRHAGGRARHPDLRAHARARDARGPLPRADRRERQRAMSALRSEWLKLRLGAHDVVRCWAR